MPRSSSSDNFICSESDRIELDFSSNPKQFLERNAKIIGVNVKTLRGWENNVQKPIAKYMKLLNEFLGVLSEEYE
ncbi:hypothetical protein DCC39_14965 [Pueribacillus theae]|uniref:HTH cro/C1-type domain-containing protein n=1 Tax=Pueribacillus theae TaxID=2171751 RepID=A0A2U1JU56_9BACI|nr:hypothetical protein [Pueribacillus theae]PWA08383.1 hypothetical protein DCC39_14965 [Pueribacillus theae]